MARDGRRARAYHLAGGAAVAVFHGLTLTELSLDPLTSPRALVDLEGIKRGSREARAVVVAALAGAPAEGLLGGRPLRSLRAADQAVAMALACELRVTPHALVELGDRHHQAYLDRLEALAARVVRWDYMQADIERLASHLLRREKPLPGAEAKEVLLGRTKTPSRDGRKRHRKGAASPPP